MPADRSKVPYWTCTTPEAKRIWCINRAREDKKRASADSQSRARRRSR